MSFMLADAGDGFISQGGSNEARLKQSDFGLIPLDWELIEASKFEPFITSGSRGWAKYYDEFGAPFLRIGNLSRKTIHPDLDNLKHVNLRTVDSEAKRTSLRDGDILISITADIGIIGFISPKIPKPAYINQHIACLRFSSDDVNAKFMGYFLTSEAAQQQFLRVTDAGAKTGINLTTVGKLKLFCPPRKEQDAIAEALSDADALIEGLESLIAKKRLIKQGVMQDLLSARRRLPGFSGAWALLPLAALGTWKGGGTPSMANASYWAGGDIPWATSADIRQGHISDNLRTISAEATRESSTTVLPGGSVIVVTRSGILRRFLPTCVVSRPTAINQDLKGLIPHQNYSGRFLECSLQSCDEMIRSRCMKSGTTVESIEFRWLLQFQINVPLTIEEQTAIATVLSDMDEEIAALEERLAKTRAVKQGMMQELLTGRIRLV